MRFASNFFDQHRNELSNIDDYAVLDAFIRKQDLESKFLSFAASRDGLKPSSAEWQESKAYMMPQVNALVARYSKLGENAFYKMYLDIDECVKKALTAR